MIKVDLITGFLGAGKTTFLIEYAQKILAEGKKVAIIVNDYGAINVDRLLIHKELGDQCQIEMVIGGDRDCSRRRLKTKLITMALEGYQQVLVEPSGLFEVDDFFDLLYEDPLERWYEMGNVITVVESGENQSYSDYAKYILAKQISKAGAIVASKVEHPQQLLAMKQFLESLSEDFQCNLKEIPLYGWTMGNLDDETFQKLWHSGYGRREPGKSPQNKVQTFESLFFFHVEISGDVKTVVEQLMQNPEAGNIFRLKGFLKQGDEWLEVNATKQGVNITRTSVGQEVFIVIGEALNHDVIAGYWTRYVNE